MKRRKNPSNEKDERYGEHWQKISRDARRQIKICCYCLVCPSTETHHVRYVNNKGTLLLDNVRLGIDVFPVCDSCHNLMHSKGRWITYGDHKYNKNNDLTINKLEFGYLVNSGGKLL